MRYLPKPISHYANIQTAKSEALSAEVDCRRTGENARNMAGKVEFLTGRRTHLRKADPLEKSSTEIAQHLRDIEELSRTALRQKYPGEYTCWRNMKQRARSNVAPEFMQFPDFLRHMRPRPRPECSVDRIDNDNPQYGPGLCRWANKHEQANNRGTTVYLIYSGRKYPEFQGQTHPRAQWAYLTRQKPDTLRKRMKAGWTHTEAIEGERSPAGECFKWPFRDDKVKWGWEQRYLASTYEDRLLFLRDGLQFAVDQCQAEIGRTQFTIERQRYLGKPDPGCEEIPFNERDLVPLEKRLEVLQVNLEEAERRLAAQSQEQRQEWQSEIRKTLRTLPRFGNPGLERKKRALATEYFDDDEDLAGEDEFEESEGNDE